MFKRPYSTKNLPADGFPASKRALVQQISEVDDNFTFKRKNITVRELKEILASLPAQNSPNVVSQLSQTLVDPWYVFVDLTNGNSRDGFAPVGYRGFIDVLLGGTASTPDDAATTALAAAAPAGVDLNAGAGVGAAPPPPVPWMCGAPPENVNNSYTLFAITAGAGAGNAELDMSGDASELVGLIRGRFPHLGAATVPAIVPVRVH